ncbi:MAG: hypothetical protein K2I47_02150 [Odoribacter sp.]|nr:hypothetical protein [Odoribacter sp.]
MAVITVRTEYAEREDVKMEENLVCVGLVVTDAGDKTVLVSWGVGEEGASCYYNNDPYGIVGCHGFVGLHLKGIELPKNGEVSAAYKEVEAVLGGGLYGNVQAVIACEEGLLLIRDTTYFTGDFLRKGSQEITPLEKGMIILSDGEDDLDEDKLEEMAYL